ncbi:MAG: adenine-specific methyltransferase EcoRI family protein [Planctomycetaceae bacterium]|nr:adenine-specific methyltransferase EcoRI family protein [Planctomycetaceae bacterium]
MAKKTENKTGNTNTSLRKAKSAKNDEFYTQLADIERECEHYKEQFRGKVILCNCDDPRVSNFFRYFFTSFYRLGLKKIISVCYKNLNPDLFSQHKDEQAVYCIYDGKDRNDDVIEDGDYEAFVKRNEWNVLQGNGDFRSEECIELLKQADIVVTNPPFSLFREFVAQLVEYDKKFIIIGSKNAVSYKEIFPLIVENKLWLGYGFNGGNAYFKILPEAKGNFADGVYDEETGLVKFRNISWFTNLDTKKRHEVLDLFSRYSPERYSHYDNYDAIEVSKVADIPCDYDGKMGVPITFLDVYNPEQFEIICDSRYNDLENPDRQNDVLLNGIPTYRRIIIRKRQRTTI